MRKIKATKRNKRIKYTKKQKAQSLDQWKSVIWSDDFQAEISSFQVKV